ncbi:MAG: bifunctional folylpolyglutamate synthase/dihydrofolate synthase [Alphaproteobacteria bacterium]|nr:bifunctional folylpolyglutamate synthase/dihydrofolate synthase [Alphaproteobacteria bacterium]
MHKADLIHPNKSLQDKLERIYALRRTRSKVNWERDNFQQLLENFGNPHKSLPPIIHVAGTNGKGSVIAFLKAMLEADGKRVHAYTSPHLIRVNERIVLAGEEISDDYLEKLIDQAMECVGDRPMSFFEMITAIAFRAFADVEADVLLLEVGMGGRLDCTNIIDKPLISVINRISKDHAMFLGETIHEIAKEKAGIMKENVPCVVGYQGVGEQAEIIVNVLKQHALELNTSLHFADIHLERYEALSLSGDHQKKNAALAVAALEILGEKLPVSRLSILEGLKKAQWRARLQKIDPKSLGLQDAFEIWLDAGHNDSAGEVLAQHFKSYDQGVYLILGMLETKDADAFLMPLIPCLKCVFAVMVPGEKSRVKIHSNVFVRDAKTVQEAFDVIQKNDTKATVLIAGSAYLAGEILKTMQNSIKN